MQYTLTLSHAIGAMLALALIFGVSIFSGRRIRSGAEFDSGSGRAGSAVVAGAIMGTLVGGSSTVGTAQLAYHYGLSAWWFTLGGGIACAVLALLYVVPLRRSGCTTIVGIIAREYGKPVGIAASLLSSVGAFISFLSQLIAASAVIAIVFPGLPAIWAIAASAVLMAAYVIFGGVLGTGMTGIVKLVLLYVTVIAGGGMALVLSGGIGSLWNALDHATYFNLFARGIGTDAGAGLSLLLGVLTTQSYAQPILAGSSDRAARRGALLSAVLTPPIGIGGILIGLYMRANVPELASAKLAFPQFILDHLPALPAGLILATLLITVIGTGAGLSLGISTVINRDIIQNLTKRFTAPRANLRFSRFLILLVLALACGVCACPIGDMMLEFSFMSMGLRGAVLMVPLAAALWLPGRLDSRWVMAAVIASPAVVLVFGLWGILPFDPLFAGVAASALLCTLGLRRKV